MRALIALAVLSLAACGEEEQVANEAAAQESASPESLPANDTTGIDAVSGEDSMMAQDVNILENADANAADAESNSAGD